MFIPPSFLDLDKFSSLYNFYSFKKILAGEEKVG